MSDHQPLHPTPQLARAGWQNLNGTWQFDYDDEDRGLAENWHRPEHELGGRIVVPFPPESRASGVGDTGFHPVLWYRTELRQDQLATGDRLVLHFGAVDYRATVFLNGERALEHEGGMTPFTVDATAYLQGRASLVVTIRVEDDPQDLSQPRGKQDWRPETSGIFYERTSGIWQPVWSEIVPADHITDVSWTSDRTELTATAAITLSRPSRGDLWAVVRLSVDGEQLALQRVQVPAGSDTTTLQIQLDQRVAQRRDLVWSPDNPMLLDAEIQLEVDGAEGDRVESYLGVRSVGFADGRFTLNGQPYYLRLVLEQGYWADSHLAAPDEDAFRAEVEAIKALGFNGARIHQKVEDPRFLYWCDRLGLLVWGEMANAFVYSERSLRRLVAEWPEVVRRDRSHPSIVAWVPINESWGVSEIAEQVPQQHFASAMYHLTKALDPTRPTMSNEGWEHTQSDIWGIHDYTPDAESIRERYGSTEELERTLTDRNPGRRRVLLDEQDHRGQPIMITEFGGLSYAPSRGENWFGYSTIESEDEFLQRLEELFGAIAELADIAGFCYTQLTDTLQEANGLLYADRTSKLPLERVHEIVSQPSKAIPAETIDAYRRRASRRAVPDTQG
ncbi:glycoside hydrolase family 2 TIM barrel-domain containing protein [Microlunatus panaciterrae]|uniref:Beta-galactosidase/beta-glucuronidase n=1 Tax=Microlunatus panaciterrae TaxID=400768 RepID=A0ABS2RGW5_9ACTN|nr:glycoside hydrolase family 2 TIM barrel-domain containing protein [Microlunatus panaciterrae]MBM7797431.1 beta-galactosidase/beta-glucuronidase [Microlunatus panaciterrae]